MKLKALLVACILLGLLGCGNKIDKRLNLPDVKATNFLSSCVQEGSSQTKTISDSLKSYHLEIPKDWDWQHAVDEDVNGIFAMDTSLFTSKNLIHTIFINTVVAQSSSLLDHFVSDIQGMHSEGMSVLEVGEYQLRIDKKIAFWALTETENDNTLFLYANGASQKDVLVLSISVSKGSDFRDRICSFKSILDSWSLSQIT